MWQIIVLTGTFLYLLYTFLKPKRAPNFPPGPDAYPVVGSGLYLSKLGKTAEEKFRKLSDKFGQVSGIFLGSNPVIIINGYEATKTFYACDEFAGRPDLFSINHRWGGRALGLIFSSGRLWQEQKRFTLRHLRDFGYGKTESMEGLILEECEAVIKAISEELKTNPIIYLHDRFNVSVINILWAIVAGKRYSYDDQEFKHILATIKASFRAGNPSGILLGLLNSYPTIRHLPYFKQKFQQLRSGMDTLCKFLEITIKQHETTRDPDSPRDFMDVYLQAIESNKLDNDSTFFRNQLIQLCADMFAAGADTTANSIGFAILNMINNPDCQKKVQDELDAVVGRDRLPSITDKDSLPYTFACITESFRYSPTSPLSVPHVSMENIKLMGFDIPKGTWAMVNFTSTNKDKKFWGDPECFRPERFLDENGKIIKSKLERVLGFGAGKRACLGEVLARLTTFDLFCGIFQKFKIQVPKGSLPPSLEPVNGFTVAPQPYSAKITERF